MTEQAIEAQEDYHHYEEVYHRSTDFWNLDKLLAGLQASRDLKPIFTSDFEPLAIEIETYEPLTLSQQKEWLDKKGDAIKWSGSNVLEPKEWEKPKFPKWMEETDDWMTEQANEVPEDYQPYESKCLEHHILIANRLDPKLLLTSCSNDELPLCEKLENTKEIETNEPSTLSQQQKWLDETGDAIKDLAAKREYDNFVENEQQNCGDNTLFDQNRRIIRAVESMNAGLFKLVSETNSTVRLDRRISWFERENPILHFNDEFRVHPLALPKMLEEGRSKEEEGRSKEEENNVLFRLLEQTQEFKSDAQSPDALKVYLKQIRPLIKPFRMMTDTEVLNFKNRLNAAVGTRLTEAQKERFQQMKPDEAFRLRTVFEDTKENLRGKVMEAAMKLAERRGVEDVFEVANCVEIINKHIIKEGRKNRDTVLAGILSSDPTMMDELNFIIDAGIRRCNAHQHRFRSDLTAYYHSNKHGLDTFNAYYRERGEGPPPNPSPEQIDEIYHKMMPERLFVPANKEETTTSQYGETRTTYKMKIPHGETTQIYMGVTVSRRIPRAERWDYEPSDFSSDDMVATQ